MIYSTRSLEKKVQDRVQTILGDKQLLDVYLAFGADAFRRSSVFHGLDKFLSACNVRGKVCLEIGTWNGLTAIVLARYFDQVVTLDIAHNGLRHKIADHLGVTNIQFVDIADNREKWQVGRELDFDFAYIDGNHADDTKSDFELTKRCGRVMFQEVWPFQIPVWQTVQALPQDQVIYGGDGLALWTAPPPVAEPARG